MVNPEFVRKQFKKCIERPKCLRLSKFSHEKRWFQAQLFISLTF